MTKGFSLRMTGPHCLAASALTADESASLVRMGIPRCELTQGLRNARMTRCLTFTYRTSRPNLLPVGLCSHGLVEGSSAGVCTADGSGLWITFFDT